MNIVKNSIKLNILIVLCLPIVFYMIIRGLVEYSPISICLFKNLTGHDCWGCGITRAFNQLFLGNFKEAYNYNPRIILVAPLMFWLWLKMVIKTYKNI